MSDKTKEKELKAPEVKGTTRRDKLHAIQKSVQQRWDELKINETSRKLNADGTKREKFMVTFPYPYMNGRLHLGHAFSLTKVLTEYSILALFICFPFSYYSPGLTVLFHLITQWTIG